MYSREQIEKYLRLYRIAQRKGLVIYRSEDEIRKRFSKSEGKLYFKERKFVLGFLYKVLAKDACYIEAFVGNRDMHDFLKKDLNSAFGTCYFHIRKLDELNIADADKRAKKVSTVPDAVRKYIGKRFDSSWQLYQLT